MAAGNPPPAQASTTIGGGTVLALIAMGISVIVIAQDFSAVNVALPDIERDFDTDLSTVQWVINAYALIFGMLIVTGGRLADQFGRKRMFILGAAAFAATSFVAGAAPNIGVLIAARALMGIGGALMWPAILGMTFAALPAGKAGLAGGLIIGAAGIGQGIGPITGGALTEISWRWVQFLNVPVALLAILITLTQVHQAETPAANEKLDYAGIVTLSLALSSLLFALDQSTTWGWGDARIVGCLVVAAVMIAAFVIAERRAGPNALVPADVIGNRQFAAAGVAMALVASAFTAPLLYLPQFMQKLLGYSPLQAGLGLLPEMVLFSALSFAGGQFLYDRVGAKLMVTAGAACMAIGVLLLSLIETDSHYAALVPGMLVLGAGLGLFYGSITTAAVQSIDPSRTSLAGGLVYMFQLAGGAVGLGLTTTVVASSSNSRLTDDLAGLGTAITKTQALVLHGLLAGTDQAGQLLAGLSPAVSERITAFVGDAFVAGIRIGFRVDAALALAAAVLAALLIGTPLHRTGRLVAKDRLVAPEQTSGTSSPASR